MTTYARVVDNIAVEIFIPLPGFTLEESFTPELAAMFVEVPDGLQIGAFWNGKKWV